MTTPDATPPRLAAALAFTPPAKEKPKTTRPSVAQAAKEGFSLFPADMERIAAIRKALEAHGRKISASHAVRLALRAVKIDARTLAKILDDMAEEDGRTRRHARG